MWSPCLPARNGDVLTGSESLTLVYARDPLPEGNSVFLADPTPRSDDVPSWRSHAVREPAVQWRGPRPLAVLIPEPPSGQRWPYFDDQAEWETVAREAATVILFWIPRDLRTLPGYTTNVEFGLDVTTGRAVLGCPPDCPDPDKNRYLIWLAHRHGVAVTGTLPATVTAALDLIARTA